VEKRVFSLATTEEGCSNVVGGVCWFIIALTLFFDAQWRHDALGYLWWPVLIVGSLSWIWRYVSNRSRKLEMSDEGLVATWWPRRAVRIGWDTIRSVKPVSRYSLCNSTWLFNVTLIRVKGAGRSLIIPDSSVGFDEIMEIIEQRVPENAVAAR